MLKFGIIGAGNIAKKFLFTLNELNITPYAIASRDLNKAYRYQKQYGIKKAYGDYQDLVSDKDIDAIYIATPHSLHFEHIKMALTNHKHVICEKPLTINAKEAAIVFKMAENNNLVLLEALKTRFLPSLKALKLLLKDNVIGTITRVDASFSTTEKANRLYENQLGGGSLLDIGVYPLHFVDYLFDDLTYQTSTVTITNQVDVEETLYLTSGKVNITIDISMVTPLKKDAYIYGTKGMIFIPHYSSAQEIFVYNQNNKLIKTLSNPHKVNGFEYQIESFMHTVHSNNKVNKYMPKKTSIKIIKLMDLIRKDWNLMYSNDILIDKYYT